MIFSPHILQKKLLSPLERDEFGRPIAGSGGEIWEDMCQCRCDDNSTKEFRTENGEVFRPSFHIVCERSTAIKAGDEIRCIEGGNIRGEGRVYMIKNTNYFGYSEIWV